MTKTAPKLSTHTIALLKAFCATESGVMTGTQFSRTGTPGARTAAIKHGLVTISRDGSWAERTVCLSDAGCKALGISTGR